MVRRLLRGPQYRQSKACGACCRRASPREGRRMLFSFAIYALIYAQKPSNKVCLNASRTSKRCVSCLGMSWRRNELITLTLPKSGVVRTVCYVNGFVQPTANTRKGAYPKTITANTEKRLFICFRQRRVKERPEGDISICFCRPRRIGKWASSFSPTAS